MPHSKTALSVSPLQKPIKYSITVPGSKSFANRALVCAALAHGRSTLTQVNVCDDVRYCISALQTLGVRIRSSSRMRIEGNGGEWMHHHSWRGTARCRNSALRRLSIGNAGTAARFLIPFLPVGVTLTGNRYMQQRPLHDLLDALRQIGFELESQTGCPPVRMISRRQIKKQLTVNGSVSSQYLSALLMLAPTLPRGLRIIVQGSLVSQPYVDMTLAVMRQFGVRVRRTGYASFTIRPQLYRAATYQIPADASSAAYWWSVAAMTGSHITVNALDDFAGQPDVAVLDLFKGMGCAVQGSTVTGPVQLKPIRANLKNSPDAALSLAVVAACAQGVSELRGLAHLRAKETNRLRLLVKNLTAIGVRARATKSTLIIHGRPQLLTTNTSRDVTIHTEHDHRFAMAFAALGLRTGHVRIDHPDCVRKSYPTFWQTLRALQQHSRRQTIVLTGMRGSGKTTLGASWAKQYHARLIDLDHEIEKKVSMPLYAYITQCGMTAFRRIEHTVAKRWASAQNAIIATGGGTLVFSRNQQLFRRHYIILLTAPIQELRKRVRRDTVKGKARPPLLSNPHSNPIQELGPIWRKRKPIYLTIADRIYDSRHAR